MVKLILFFFVCLIVGLIMYFLLIWFIFILVIGFLNGILEIINVIEELSIVVIFGE